MELTVLMLLWSQDPGEFKEKLILTLPEYVNADEVHFPPQGDLAVYEKRERIGTAAGEGEIYDNVLDPVFNAAGTSFAYVGFKRIMKGGKEIYECFVIIDGRKGDAYEGIGWGNGGCGGSFSPDGKTFVYPAKKDGKWYIVAGEKKSGPHAKIVGMNSGDETSVFWSPDSRLFAYRCVEGELDEHQQGGEAYVVVGDRKFPGSAWIEDPIRFLSDGKTPVYRTQEAKTKKFLIYVGEKAGEAFDFVSHPVVSEKGDVVAYHAGNDTRYDFDAGGFVGGTWYCVVGGKKHGDFDRVDFVTVTPDGTKFAYLAKKKGKQFIVGGGQIGESFEEVGRPFFSRDGKRLAYSARNGETSYLIVDGKKSEPYDTVFCTDLWQPVFGPDGKRLAVRIIFNDGSARVYVDGNPGESFIDVTDPVFSPDGKAVAYQAETEWDPDCLKDAKCVVVNGKRSELFRKVGALTFSRDGKSVAFLAFKGREIWRKVLTVP